MGDRTSVHLTVLNGQAAAAEAIFKSYDDPTGEPGAMLTEYYFTEVNYGELSFLGDLQDAGIAYDSCWNDGAEHGAGMKSLRFTAEGGVETRERYNAAYNPPLEALMVRIDQPAELREYILEHSQSVQHLSWDNQEEYAKVFKTKQLIDP